MRKNVASQVVGAQMITAADGSVFTGSVTVYVTGNGGTQAVGSVGSGACTHEGNGFHTYAPAQAETNYDHVAFTFVGSGAVAATIQVYPSFPQTGDNYARLGAPAGASVSADIATVATYVDTEVAAILAAVDTEVAAIKAKTDNLPAAPAAVSDIPTAATVAAQVWGTSVPGAFGAGTAGKVLGDNSDSTGITTLLSRLTSTRGSNLDNLDATITSRLASASYTSPPSSATIASAVWNEAISGHLTAGSTGAALNAAGSAGDPWTTPLPGAYGAGTAGYIIGTNINATIGSRQAAIDATERNAIADALLKRDMSAVSGEAARSPLNAFRFLRNKWSISGTTLTVTKEDDATSAWSATVTAAPGADPISGSDPA